MLSITHYQRNANQNHNEVRRKIWNIAESFQNLKVIFFLLFSLLKDKTSSVPFNSVTQSCPNSLQPHEPQHIRLPCPSLTPGVYSYSCPLSLGCHPAIWSSVVPFSSHLQSFQISGSFQVSQFFTSGGQNIGFSASTSVLPMNTEDWFALRWTG